MPGLFAMLYAMMLFQDARRKIKRLGESVSRGMLIALLTWVVVLAAGHGGVVLGPRYGPVLQPYLLLASGVVGGGPMLAAALVAGLLTGALIIRPPRQGPPNRPARARRWRRAGRDTGR